MIFYMPSLALRLTTILKDLIVNDLENKNSDDILLFSGFYQGKY